MSPTFLEKNQTLNVMIYFQVCVDFCQTSNNLTDYYFAFIRS